MKEPEFSDKGKDYPMLVATEFWHMADELAALVPSKNYTEFFTFIIRNLNLPHDYSIAHTLPETLKEIKVAHHIRGDFKDRKKELESIEKDIDKLLAEFESSYIPVGFFGGNEPYVPPSRDFQSDIQKNADKKGLLEHGVDITDLVRSGSVDDVIGRKDEIWKTMLTLARRKKANPVLVGPAGVGKTQIVYGIAHLIAREEAGFLNGWTIIEMSTTGLNACLLYTSPSPRDS